MIDARVGVRVSAIIATGVGLLLALAVLGYFNFGAVLAAMRPIGVQGFATVAAAQIVLFIPLGLAWWLVSSEDVRRAPVFMWGRLSREAASDVLPFSQLGGVLIATRVAVLGGVSLARATGSCMVDITFEIVAQLIYTLIGVALLVRRLGAASGASALLTPILGGVAIAACVIAVVVLTQRRGLRLIERLAERIAPNAGHGVRAFTAAVEQAYVHKPRLLVCLGLHIGCWFGAAAGTWLILGFIGHRLPFLSVVAIESLLFAIRNAAFVVPSGIGVQEGAYALIGPLFGLPAEAALALSLLKRARDIGIGVPVLLTWQLAEIPAVAPVVTDTGCRDLVNNPRNFSDGRALAGVVTPGDGPDIFNPIPEYNTPRRFLSLGEDLPRRGWPNTRIEKLVGGNFGRVFSDIWDA